MTIQRSPVGQLTGAKGRLEYFPKIIHLGENVPNLHHADELLQALESGTAEKQKHVKLPVAQAIINWVGNQENGQHIINQFPKPPIATRSMLIVDTNPALNSDKKKQSVMCTVYVINCHSQKEIQSRRFVIFIFTTPVSSSCSVKGDRFRPSSSFLSPLSGWFRLVGMVPLLSQKKICSKIEIEKRQTRTIFSIQGIYFVESGQISPKNIVESFHNSENLGRRGVLEKMAKMAKNG